MRANAAPTRVHPRARPWAHIVAAALLAAVTSTAAAAPAARCTLKGLGHVAGFEGQAFNFYGDAVHLMSAADGFRVEVATTPWVDRRHAVVTGVAVRCGDALVRIVDPRAASDPVAVSVNGDPIALAADTAAPIAGAPDADAWSIRTLVDDPGRYHLRVSCGVGATSATLPTGLAVDVIFLLQGDRNTDTGAVIVEADPRWRRQLDGACGWGARPFRLPDVKRKYLLEGRGELF